MTRRAVIAIAGGVAASVWTAAVAAQTARPAAFKS